MGTCVKYSRNKPWMIMVNAVEAARTYLPILLAYYLYRSQIGGSLGTAVDVLFSLYSCVTAYSIFTHWATRLFAFDSEGIKYRQGVFAKVDVSLLWSAVAAIEVHRDPVRGIAGCCKVVVRASSGIDREIVLDTVPCGLANEIRRASGLPVSQINAGDASPGSSEDGTSAPVFAASQWDLLVMSLAYGRFAFFVPFVVEAYSEYAEMVGLPDPEWIVARGFSASLASQLAWFMGIAAISIAYGYAVTLLRFWGFRASVADGSLVLEGGMFASQRRAIPLDRVIGLALRRNTFELLTGRGRLALLTRDADQVLGKNVVLPALKMDEIGARVDAFGGDASELFALDRVPIRIGRVWWVAGARVILTVSTFGLVLTASGLWRYYAAALAFVIPLCLIAVNGCYTYLMRDRRGERILYRRGLMSRSSYSLPLSEVRVLRTDTRPWDRWMGLRRVSLYYFSGGTRRLFAWRSSVVRSAVLHVTE